MAEEHLQISKDKNHGRKNRASYLVRYLALAFNSGLIRMALIRMALAIVDMKAYTGMARGHGCLILRFVNLQYPSLKPSCQAWQK
jgi:hypothetical protein